MNLLYNRIQSDYEKKTGGRYSIAIPLYELEPHTKDFLAALYENVGDVKYKYEILMFSDWVPDSPVYKCGNDYYTHIKIKSRLV